MITPYEILGVDTNATPEEIKKAYKSKAGKCHPDKNPDDPDANTKFQILQEAYKILKDPEKRSNYDRTGSAVNILDIRANECIAKIYLELAERANYEPRDYLLEVTKATQNSLRQCMADKAQLGIQKDRLTYLIENTAAGDLLIKGLEMKLHEVTHQKENAEEALEVMNRALELLDEYKYTGTVPTATPGMRPWTTDPYVGA